MATFRLPNGIKVNAPDDWTADQVMAEYQAGNLGPIGPPETSLADQFGNWLSEHRPTQRTGSFWEEAASPWKEAAAEQSPIWGPLKLLGAPFATAGRVVEKGAESLVNKSTPETRVLGLLAELGFPAEGLVRGAGGLSRFFRRGPKAVEEVTKALQEAGVPAEKIAEVLSEAQRVRPLSTSELLSAAKQSQTPVPAEREAERLLRQAKNIDTGAHTPSIFDTAEDLVNRRAYKPVEARPLHTPEPIRPSSYTERELETLGKRGPLSQAEKTEAYRQRIGLAEPSEPVVAAAKAAAPLAEAAPLAQRALEGTARTLKESGVTGWAHTLYDRGMAPLLSRMESLGGHELSRLEQRKNAQASFIFRDLFEPLYRALHGMDDSTALHFIDVVQGGAIPTDVRIAGLAKEWERVFGSDGLVVNAFRQHGIKVNPRENFFPREFSQKVRNAILNDKEYQSNLITQIADSNGISRVEARRALISTIGRKPIIGRDRKIAAEYARSIDLPDYIKDPAQVTALRGWAVANRLAEIMVYGPKDSNVLAAIRSAAGGNTKLGDQLYKLFELTIRRDPVEAGLAEWARKAMTWQAFTKLPLAAIANLGQPVLGVLRTNLSTAAKGLVRFLLSPSTSRDLARETALSVDMIVRRNLVELTGGTGGQAVQRVLGPYNFVERGVREVAAQQGQVWAERLQRLVQAGTDAPWLRRELRNLLFDPQEINRILSTRSLTPDDVRLIRYAMAEQVVFVPRAARRSEAMLRDPKLAVLLQFKNFVSNSTRLLKNAVLEDARRGNIRPLYHLLSAAVPGVMVGEMVADLRAYARGSDRPPIGTPAQIAYRLLDDLLAVGSMGIGLDLLNAAERDPAGLVTWAAGPTFGDLGRVAFRGANLAGAAVTGNWPEAGRQLYETGRLAVRQIPVAGSFLANRIIPTSVRRPTFEDEGYWDRLGFTQRARERARYLDQQRRNQSQRGAGRIFRNLGIE